MRTLVFLDDAPIFGGAERNVLRLARFVQETTPARPSRVICPSGSELAHHCRLFGITVHDAGFPGFELFAPFRIPRAVVHLRRVLVEVAADAVVVGVTLRSQVYAHAAVLRLRRPPRIVHFLPEQDSARRLTAKLLLRRFGAAVVVGENAARTYQELAPDVHVGAVSNFLLAEEFAAAARRAEAGPREIAQPPVLGVLTRLFPGKGVVELIDELAENSGSWSDLLVGGGRQDEQYAAEVESRIVARRLDGRVRLIGHVGNFADFFDRIDALVVPSVGNEGQPTVILEALASGRPVVVREPIWSSAFEGLPVAAYRDARDLGAVLQRLEPALIAPNELAARFGPAAVVEAIDAAARYPGQRRVGPTKSSGRG